MDTYSSLSLNYPAFMGFLKFAILATLGECFARVLVARQLPSRLFQRAFMWGVLGMVLTYVFPIYAAGVKGLINAGRLPGNGSPFFTALWISIFMNLLFAFPMMIGHRISDMLIDRNLLFRRWPFMHIWKSIDWDNLWTFVAPTCVWFWIPAHTVTFMLPEESRILFAALLSMCLGLILAFAKMRARS